MSGKSLDEFIQPEKDRLRWQNSPDLCHPVLTIMLKRFQKKYVILLLSFTKANPSTSEKSYPIAYILPGKKKSP